MSIAKKFDFSNATLDRPGASKQQTPRPIRKQSSEKRSKARYPFCVDAIATQNKIQYSFQTENLSLEGMRLDRIPPADFLNQRISFELSFRRGGKLQSVNVVGVCSIDDPQRVIFQKNSSMELSGWLGELMDSD